MSRSIEEMLGRAINIAVESISDGDEARAERALAMMFALALLEREGSAGAGSNR